MAVVVLPQRLDVACHVVVSQETVTNWRNNQVSNQGICAC